MIYRYLNIYHNFKDWSIFQLLEVIIISKVGFSNNEFSNIDFKIPEFLYELVLKSQCMQISIDLTWWLNLAQWSYEYQVSVFYIIKFIFYSLIYSTPFCSRLDREKKKTDNGRVRCCLLVKWMTFSDASLDIGHDGASVSPPVRPSVYLSVDPRPGLRVILVRKRWKSMESDEIFWNMIR